MTQDIFRPGPIGLESRFTPSTEACPHPERWHSTDADSTEIEVSQLIAGLVVGLQPELVVETGSAWGQTTKLIGEALRHNGHGELHSIEPDPERVEHTRNLCTAKGGGEWLPVKVHEMKSLDWVPPGPIDFAFFDSLIELRVPEFEGYLPHMHQGTIVAFHDTADHHGLWPHIAGLERAGKLLPIRLPTPRGLVIAEVISRTT